MILPGATVGVIGGGQLGRMFVLQARTMGYRVVVLDPDPGSPAGQVADEHLQAPYTDLAALDRLASSCAAVTTEFENVPAESLERLARSCRVRPPVAAVAIAQDRIAEKTFLVDAGFRTAPFRPVRTEAELADALRSVRLPALLKTSRLGYDGKGQATIERPEDGAQAFARFGRVACVLEERLALETELSVVLARGDDGAVAAFPVGENRHRDGILETTVVPARVSRAIADEARDTAARVAAALPYVGVLGVELFVAERRPHLRQRDRPAAAQQRALHARCVLRGPVRAAAPRALRPAAGAADAPQSGRHGEPAGRSLVRRHAALGRSVSTPWCPPASVRQGRAQTGAEDGSPELPGRRSRPRARPRARSPRRAGRSTHSQGVTPQ